MRHLLVLLVVLCTSYAANVTLPVISVSGSHYEVGRQIGLQMKDRIHGYIFENDFFQSTLIPFSKSVNGSKIVQQFTKDNMEAYPHYFEEIHGLSDGSAIPFDWLLLLNLEYEISLLIQAQYGNNTRELASEVSCTDVLLKTASDCVDGHNEDAGPLVRKYGYMVTAQFTNGDVGYTAYTYPGQLAGNAFGFNKFVTLTTNALFPKGCHSSGLARGFVNRDIYSAVSAADAIARATRTGVASGFSLNVGSLTDLTLQNVEVGPGGAHYLTPVATYYAHMNNYRNLPIAQYVDVSSTHRLARFSAMTPPMSSVQDILKVLGDTQDKQWPIYRTDAAPDDCDTVATVVFQLTKREAVVLVTNPAVDPTPYHIFHL